MRHGRLIRALRSVVLLSVVPTLRAYGGETGARHSVNPALILPFVLLLIAIAAGPLINKRWWERYSPYVCAGLALIVIAYYAVVLQNSERMLHTGLDYISFISLIGSLFVVAGGIHIRIKGRSTPLMNVLFLAIGAVVSNLLGTTGASMILVRPFLRVNKYRLRGYHVAFFIFLVSNIGGALTPIGDPPLFLGYLKGVPFFWVFESCWPIWAVALSLVLAAFFIIDSRSFRQFKKEHHDAASLLHEEAEIEGLHNIAFLAVILLSVFIERPVMLRECLMLIAATGSYVMTKKTIHEKNEFSFAPVKDVAVLFAGIFATMVPALDWLEANASHLGINSAGHFFWWTGALSSVLDNAPTYLSFLSASIGLLVDETVVSQVQHLISTHGADMAMLGNVHSEEIQRTFSTLMKYHSDLVAAGHVPLDEINVAFVLGNYGIYLKAISMGAVFFGAFTYIGNGPNFMVKSIAEHAGAEVPTFLGYVMKYSLPILLPMFVIIWALFFR